MRVDSSLSRSRAPRPQIVHGQITYTVEDSFSGRQRAQERGKTPRHGQCTYAPSTGLYAHMESREKANDERKSFRPVCSFSLLVARTRPLWPRLIGSATSQCRNSDAMWMWTADRRIAPSRQQQRDGDTQSPLAFVFLHLPRNITRSAHCILSFTATRRLFIAASFPSVVPRCIVSATQ